MLILLSLQEKNYLTKVLLSVTFISKKALSKSLYKVKK